MCPGITIQENKQQSQQLEDDKMTSTVLNKELLAEELKAFRKSLGMSQEAFGACLNYSKDTISKWENGKRIPSLEDFCKIGIHFHVNIFELITRCIPESSEKEDYTFMSDTLVDAVSNPVETVPLIYEEASLTRHTQEQSVNQSQTAHNILLCKWTGV